MPLLLVCITKVEGVSAIGVYFAEVASCIPGHNVPATMPGFLVQFPLLDRLRAVVVALCSSMACVGPHPAAAELPMLLLAGAGKKALAQTLIA